MRYKVRVTSRFKRDLKLAKKQGKDFRIQGRIAKDRESSSRSSFIRIA